MNTKLLRFFLVTSLCLPIGVVMAQPSADLVHSYTFEDGTGNDVVGTAHGVAIGATDFAAGAMITTGPDQGLELPGDEIAINTYDEITLEVLYTPAAGLNTGYTMITYFGDTAGGLGTNYFFLSAARGDNVSRAAISVGATTEPWAAESGANGTEYDDGNLHHMVGTLTNEEVALYLDGALANAVPLAEHNSIAGISNNLAYLARGGYTADPIWMGAIHEFNIYDRALTADEVAELYAIATAIEEDASASLPRRFSLSQNYPNPFNPATTIDFAVAERAFVNVSIFDVLGNEVAVLAHGEKAPGNYTVRFDGTGLSSGVYFCTMRAGTFRQTRKLVLMK